MLGCRGLPTVVANGRQARMHGGRGWKARWVGHIFGLERWQSAVSSGRVLCKTAGQHSDIGATQENTRAWFCDSAGSLLQT